MNSGRTSSFDAEVLEVPYPPFGPSSGQSEPKSTNVSTAGWRSAPGVPMPMPSRSVKPSGKRLLTGSCGRLYTSGGLRATAEWVRDYAAASSSGQPAPAPAPDTAAEVGDQIGVPGATSGKDVHEPVANGRANGSADATSQGASAICPRAGLRPPGAMPCRLPSLVWVRGSGGSCPPGSVRSARSRAGAAGTAGGRRRRTSRREGAPLAAGGRSGRAAPTRW
jgi:hypothetical protein